MPNCNALARELSSEMTCIKQKLGFQSIGLVVACFTEEKDLEI